MIVLTVLLGGGFLALFGTLGYQAYLYLRYGEWLPISATAFCGAQLEVEWCASPQDWLGVHQMLSWFNAGAFAWLVAMAVLVALMEGTKGG